ncbi:hypothetical protein [Leucobacter sp. NPDC077196]|uniref:hypothetical protein n=1 Tax=Leucobacter sp. NPDC077196 TaxID=3154959 RepID=UPI003446154F
MISEPRRGVTRGYVASLIGAAIITAVALLVAVWGGLALLLDRDPVATEGVASWIAPLVVFGGLALLAMMLWRQAITLLQGRREPAWSSLVAVAAGIYLWWGALGMLAGMPVEETWLSPFAAALSVIWVAAALVFWAVLARRVYTDRPTPRWPWERDEESD